MRRIGILTVGADAPGQNAAIRAVARAAFQHSYEVLGIRSGFKGLLSGDLFVMDRCSVSGILPLGGTILGTSVGNPFKDEENISQLKMIMQKYSLTALVLIGGYSYMKIASQLNQADIPLIGIPATIDNDIPFTDKTIGFTSAIEFVAHSLDRLHSTASSHHRVFLVEVMGGGTGWIGLMGGLSGGADLILIPEKTYQLEEIYQHIQTRQSNGKEFSIIVASEEVVPPMHKLQEKAPKCDIIDYLYENICSNCSFEVRKLVLGHLQRGGAPSVSDRILATQLGVHAIDMLRRGEIGKMASIYQGKLCEITLEKIEERKKVDLELLEVARLFY